MEWCGNREKRQRGVLLLPVEMGSRVEGREPTASRVLKEQGEQGRRQPQQAESPSARQPSPRPLTQVQGTEKEYSVASVWGQNEVSPPEPVAGCPEVSGSG